MVKPTSPVCRLAVAGGVWRLPVPAAALAGNQVFSRFCLEHCLRFGPQPSSTGQTTKSFPGFLSSTAFFRSRGWLAVPVWPRRWKSGSPLFRKPVTQLERAAGPRDRQQPPRSAALAAASRLLHHQGKPCHFNVSFSFYAQIVV